MVAQQFGYDDLLGVRRTDDAVFMHAVVLTKSRIRAKGGLRGDRDGGGIMLGGGAGQIKLVGGGFAGRRGPPQA